MATTTKTSRFAILFEVPEFISFLNNTTYMKEGERYYYDNEPITNDELVNIFLESDYNTNKITL